MQRSEQKKDSTGLEVKLSAAVAVLTQMFQQFDITLWYIQTIASFFQTNQSLQLHLHILGRRGQGVT